MTSEILTELKALSTKIDNVQSEISELYKVFVDHLPVCQSQNLRVSELHESNCVRKESSKSIEDKFHKSPWNETNSHNKRHRATTAPNYHKLETGTCTVPEQYELSTCTEPERNEPVTNICTIPDRNEPVTKICKIPEQNEPIASICTIPERKEPNSDICIQHVGNESTKGRCSVHEQNERTNDCFTANKRNEPATGSFTTPTLNEPMLGYFTAPKRNESKTNFCSVPEDGEEQNCEDIDKSTIPKRISTKENVLHGEMRHYSNSNFKECREQCLRKALQQSVVLLVENLPYTENDILDKLIENECLTETECSDLRNNGSRKDCVRNLVRIIKGRSYKVIKTFVDCIKTLHPEVATSIWQLYEKLVKDKKNYSRQCSFCVLKRSVDLKNLADHIWSVGAISDELYDQIVDARSNKEIMWTQLAAEFNMALSQVRQKVLRMLTAALMRTGQYRQLVMELSKVSELKCACVKMEIDSSTPSFSAYDQTNSASINDFDENTSVSPRSTTESSSRNSTDISEILSDDEENEFENYFSSQLMADHNRVLYNSNFGLRKGSIHNLGYVGVEMRKQRSNSSGKCQKGNFSFFNKRRASMFM